jgi:hypothetical protein
VSEVLTFLVGIGFDLEGRVFHGHVEVFGHTFLELAKNCPGMAVAEARVVDDYVSAKNREPGRDERGVKVVHVANVVDAKQVRPHIVKIQARRCGLQEN